MQRCLQLARNGSASAAPNPMVGAVLVQGDAVLAEGWHRHVGGAHAEVECLRAFGDAPVPSDAMMYVNLEPCDHHGRTPPCSELLIARGVKHVVIAHEDPFAAVAGKGIARLKAAGITTLVGPAAEEARWTNRRFLTSVEKGRPYLVLKWAQSSDGLMDQQPRGERSVQRISDPATDVLVHRWRSEEQAIVVGSRTVINDDPQLNVRHVDARSPLRIVIDREGRTPASSRIFDQASPTLLFNIKGRMDLSVEQFNLSVAEDPLDQLLTELHRRSVRSLMVEGGAELLGHFISRGLWDEARMITGTSPLRTGTRAPVLPMDPGRSFTHSVDRIDLFVNTDQHQMPSPQWYWC